MRSADWELDFYSRPILEADGRKRWELLITSTPNLSDQETPFRFVKCCPSGEVNSLWLTEALQEAGASAEDAGWDAPRRLRCWRSSMRTICLLYTSPSPRDLSTSRMPSSA